MTLLRYVEIIGFRMKRGLACYRTPVIPKFRAYPNELPMREAPDGKVCLRSIREEVHEIEEVC